MRAPQHIGNAQAAGMHKGGMPSIRVHRVFGLLRTGSALLL